MTRGSRKPGRLAETWNSWLDLDIRFWRSIHPAVERLLNLAKYYDTFW